MRGSGLALAGIFALALAVRLLLIRQLAYPSWVDSYHHTIITQIILETGRVPANYYPYADLDRFLYHFGYHADSAFLAWATGLPAHRAVLWGGQVLNALTVPSLFFLVDRLAKDRRAALVAALFAGLVCRMPAYYVNWGRYTQLAGQLLFPVALAVAAEAVLRPQPSWRALLLAGLFAGGLAFTHYRVFIFYLVGMILLAGVALWRERRGERRLAGQVWRLVAIGLIALALVWPWLPALLAKTVSAAQQVLATGDGGQYDYLTLDFVLGYGLRWGELSAALLAALWLLGRARRRPLGALVLLWLGLMFFLANPVVSGMPSGFMPNGTVIVGLYLPAAVLVGLAAGDMGQRVARALWGSRTLKICASLGWTLLALWGAQDMLAHTLEPWYQLVTPADERAMAWVEAHTSPEAVFAVGTDFWLPSAATGSDAGYWLPYIAHRRTIVPPMIYISEGDPSYVAEKQALLAPLAASTTPKDLADALRRSGATYIYVSNRTPRPWQASLDEAAYFERLYEAEGVRVYHLK